MPEVGVAGRLSWDPLRTERVGHERQAIQARANHIREFCVRRNCQELGPDSFFCGAGLTI